MLDLNFIRQNPDEVKARLIDLNLEAPIDEILQLDQRRRDLLKEVEGPTPRKKQRQQSHRSAHAGG